MRILIDADGCPVVNQTITLASEFAIECFILCDTSHEFHREGAHTIVLSKGADSVDFALVNMIQAGDIVVTQDYGLAAMCLARKGKPINQNGVIYNEKNIDQLLDSRYIAQKIRRGGRKRAAVGKWKGPTKRTKEQDDNFVYRLRKLLIETSKTD